jgi:hypothetical protein
MSMLVSARQTVAEAVAVGLAKYGKALMRPCRSAIRRETHLLRANRVPSTTRSRLHHHGIVSFSQRVNLPVGPSDPSSATRTASRAPCSTVSAPEYPLRFVLV